MGCVFRILKVGVGDFDEVVIRPRQGILKTLFISKSLANIVIPKDEDILNTFTEFIVHSGQYNK